jgi:KaiC/GvpD/RAD55 family RecA-like ATPase
MKLSVNRAVVNKSKDWEILATRFVNEDLSLDQLALEVNAGHAFSTQHKGRRQQNNFLAAGYIALDFDRAGPDDVLEIMSDPIVSNYHGLFYYTFSSTPQAPKFRIVFELDNPIYDPEYYREVVTAFIWKFAANADDTCTDPCRLFYGSKDSSPTFTNNILPMSVVAKVRKNHRVYLDQERKDQEAADAERRKVLTPSGGNSEKGKKAFLEKVLDRHCERIRAAIKGERHHTLRNSSRVMGGYLQGEPGLVTETEIRRRLEEAYSGHPGLNRREMHQTIQWGIEHGKTNPLYIPELPDYKKILDFSEWSGQSQGQPSTQKPPSNVDTETGEVIDGEPGEPKKETYQYFPLLTFEELGGLPKPTWLIEPILVRGYLACIYGPTQTAKSFLMLDLALQAAAAGHKVIYVIAESANGYYARANAWYRYHEQIPNDNIRFIPMPVQLLLPEQVLRLETTIDDFYKEDPPAFVIFDTLSKCYVGGDENDAKDMRLFVSACDNLRRKYNATIGVVHHSPKMGGSPRGSSVITGDFDTIIETAKKVDNDQKLITVKCEKQKDAKEFGTKLYRLQTTGDLFEFEDSCVLVEEDESGNTGNYQNQDRLPALGRTILETLNQSAIESEGLTSAKLMSILEIDPKTEKSAKAIFFRVLSKIVDLRLAEKVLTGRSPVFKVTQAGKDYLLPQDLF